MSKGRPLSAVESAMGREIQHGPFVPVELVCDLLAERRPDLSLSAAFLLAGISDRRARLIRAGQQQHLSFANADKIVCRVLEDPGLWQSEPALSGIYERA